MGMTDFRRTRELLEDGEAYGAGPGRECVVFYKQEPVFCHIAGFRDRERGIPLSGEEFFDLFSCTKLLTCTASMMLWERGAFRLEDPVEKYLPEFGNMLVQERLENGRSTLRPARTPMLVYHLLTMSAGLNYDLKDEAVQAARDATEGFCPTLETIRFLGRRPLDFDPGERFQYSLCHDVLGALIEVWSGMGFYRFLKKEIFDPLGMKETFFHLPGKWRERKAVRYMCEGEGKDILPCAPGNPFVPGDAYESGGAGIVSTLDDYARFVGMLSRGGKMADGKRILEEETLKRMATPVPDEKWQETFQTAWLPGYHYGLGVYVLWDAKKAGSLASPGTFGWNGAAGSYVSVDPKAQIAVLYIQHMHSPGNKVYHDRLRNTIYREILGEQEAGE